MNGTYFARTESQRTGDLLGPVRRIYTSAIPDDIVTDFKSQFKNKPEVPLQLVPNPIRTAPQVVMGEKIMRNQSWWYLLVAVLALLAVKK